MLMRFGSDVVALLRCSRYSLGIMESSRGVIAGRLLLQFSKGIQAADLKILRERLEQEELMPKLALSAPKKKKLTGRVSVVLKACSDLKFGSSLLDFECHFNEALEKKM
ncbi:unnamed protein product [Camellia sinensis]